MAEIDTEIRNCSRHIVDLTNLVDTQSVMDTRLKVQANAIKSLTKADTQFTETRLFDVQAEAPFTFEQLWPSTAIAIYNYSKEPHHAIERLGLFFGRAYIESIWNSQTNGFSDKVLGGPSFAALAGIQLGLSNSLLDSNVEKNVLAVISSNSRLFSILQLQQFEKKVTGGLKKIDDLGARLSNWEERLNTTEGRADGAEKRIAAYQSTLDKYQVAFGFLGMSAAYKDFFKRKRMERLLLGAGLVVLFIAILAIPLFAYHETNLNDSNKTFLVENSSGSSHVIASLPVAPSESVSQAKRDKTNTISQPLAALTKDDGLSRLLIYIPFTAFLFLLIYFFRVVLFHFNSTQAQMIQLELKMASFGFIEEYVKFLKENNSPDLSKFEALIFGGIVADLNKVPSTFDGLDQLLKAVSQAKGDK